MTEADQDRIGEVVEANTHNFTVQCYRLYKAPPLGAIIRSVDPSIFAVVSQVSTQSLDPGRPVIARGEKSQTINDVYQSNPQLSRLLCTRFQGLTIGYTSNEVLVQGLPPLPPRIHAFVYSSTPQEVAAITHSLDFLHTLVSGGVYTSDEVIVACLRQASSIVTDGSEFLVRAGKILAIELTGQFARLNAILKKLT